MAGLKKDIATEYGITVKHYEILEYRYNSVNGGCEIRLGAWATKQDYENLNIPITYWNFISEDNFNNFSQMISFVKTQDPFTDAQDD